MNISGPRINLGYDIHVYDYLSSLFVKYARVYRRLIFVLLQSRG